MTFKLFPDLKGLGLRVPKALSYLLVAFGLVLLVTGILVKDDKQALAFHEPEPEILAPAAQGQTSASDVQSQEQTQAEPTTVIKREVVALTPIDEAQAKAVAEKKAGGDYIKFSDEQVLSKQIVERKKLSDNPSIWGRLMSIFGIFGFIGIAWLMSNNRKRILWKLVAVGTGLQLIFAMFILWTPIGKTIFSALNSAITVLLNFTSAGTSFLFASYISGSIESANINTAMSILPPIIFFSSLMTILYHLGIMQFMVKGMAVFMVKLMGTSGSESLSAVSNIFVGQTEAPLVVKPYVARMTNSELFSVMTGGFATVAGGVMASYVAMLQPFFPDIAGHLIAASVMSAPATLVVAKIMFPETEVSETMGSTNLSKDSPDANVIDAAARGASEGMQLAINVAAMLIAFVALIAMVNFFLGFPSRAINASAYHHVSGYLISSGGSVDPSCDSPYSSSNTIQCTHSSLVSIAQRNAVLLTPELSILAKGQSEQIEQIDALYEKVSDIVHAPLAGSAMVNDCQNGHSISACGAIIAKTQDSFWTPSLEKKQVWPLLSLELIFGYLFFPIAFLMGVPLSDCFLVGQLLGEKMAINEFVAYLHLSNILEQLSYRSIVISTYALCGFANFGSIAIQIGGIGAMAPNRRSDLAKLGFKAMLAGTIAAFMTATIAGALI